MLAFRCLSGCIHRDRNLKLNYTQYALEDNALFKSSPESSYPKFQSK